MALDMVTPWPASVLSDAEVLSTVWDVLHDGRLGMKRRPIVVQISHRLLVEAIFIHCCIAEGQFKKKKINNWNLINLIKNSN